MNSKNVILTVVAVLLLGIIGAECYVFFNGSPTAASSKESKNKNFTLELVLYNDDSGDILDQDGKRLGGFTLSGGRTDMMIIRFASEMNFFGTITDRIYLKDGYAYSDFKDELDGNTAHGIAYERKDKGAEVHFILHGKTKTADSKQNTNVMTVEDKLKAAKTVAEVKKLIDGTTWHSTENLDNSEIQCWVKVVFKGGNYISYYAFPSDGKWTEGGRGAYTVEEGRYSNTGKKYISVNWVGKINGKGEFITVALPFEMSLSYTGTNFQLAVHSRANDALTSPSGHMITKIYYATMEYGDYKWN